VCTYRGRRAELLAAPTCNANAHLATVTAVLRISITATAITLWL
jgi:hypothetical protein